jgi:molybdopterin adenylyltransferase
MGREEHRREAPQAVRVFVVTASDSRGEAEDHLVREPRRHAA